jgi:hypothetical protein
MGKKSTTEKFVWDVTPYARQKFIGVSQERIVSSHGVNESFSQWRL